MSVLAVSQTFLANSSVDSYECTAHSSLYNVPKHPKHPPPCVNKHGGVVASLLCQLSQHSFQMGTYHIQWTERLRSCLGPKGGVGCHGSSFICFDGVVLLCHGCVIELT